MSWTALKTLDSFRDRRQREKAIEARKVVIDRARREGKEAQAAEDQAAEEENREERPGRERSDSSRCSTFQSPVNCPTWNCWTPKSQGPHGRGFSKEALEGLSKLLELKLADFRYHRGGHRRLSRGRSSRVSRSSRPLGLR